MRWKAGAKAWSLPVSAAGLAWLAILVAGGGAILALNLPGHLPFDSVNALWEGRSHVRFTWGPRMYSEILGLLDFLLPGTALYTVVSVLILIAAWIALATLRPRTAWSGPLLLVLWFAHPEVLIFQGVVWRDVLFANLTVAGFVALALATIRWRRLRARCLLLALAMACLAVAALVRQNGGVVIFPAAVALGWAARKQGVRRALAWSVGGLAAPLLLMAALDAAIPIHEAPGARSLDVGPRLLAHYDLIGAVAEDPQRPLPVLAAARPRGLPALRRLAPAAYSAVRIDTLDNYPRVGMALWRVKPSVVRQAWLHMVATDPAGYLRRRAEVFRWVFLTPRLDLCGPIHLGVSGDPAVAAKLGIRNGQGPRDRRLFGYARPWFQTPLYSHATFALIAAATAAVLLVRRSGADMAMAALVVAALGFTASFFFVSIACDYRYLYALDLAAITGSLYLALDPSPRRPLIPP